MLLFWKSGIRIRSRNRLLCSHIRRIRWNIIQVWSRIVRLGQVICRGLHGKICGLKEMNRCSRTSRRRGTGSTKGGMRSAASSTRLRRAWLICDATHTNPSKRIWSCWLWELHVCYFSPLSWFLSYTHATNSLLLSLSFYYLRFNFLMLRG